MFLNPDSGSFISSPQSQLTNPVDGIKFLCLFSLICFGRRHKGIYLTGSGFCSGYNHTNDLQSFICSDNFDTSIFGDSQLHTLAIIGSNLSLDERDLCPVNYKHLILKGLTLTKSFRDWSYLLNCKREHESVTIFNCKNINKWEWSRLPFNHLHIERTDLSNGEDLPGPNLPPQLKTLSYVSCLIKSIPKDHFVTLYSLRMLVLSRNSLKELNMNSFPADGNHKLWLLDLSYNQIAHIDSSLTVVLPNLVEINLKSNHLQTIDQSLFSVVWFPIRILDVTVNPLICNRLCWTIDTRSHPIYFDDAKCYTEKDEWVTVGAMGLVRKSTIDC